MIRKGIQKPNLDSDEEFGVENATYYAVTESASFPFTARQNLKYGNRKYNNLAAAEAALPATPTTPMIINILGTWSSAETTAIVINNPTTTATNYLLIRALGKARHTGKWSASSYRVQVSNTSGYGFSVLTANTIIKGLQLWMDTEPTALYAGFQSNSNNVLFDSCISRGPDTSYAANQYSAGFYATEAAALDVLSFYNCLAYNYFSNGTTQGLGFSVYNNHPSSIVNIFNCTAVNCDQGIIRWDSDVTVINSLAQGCDNGFDGTFSESSNYNVSDLSADAPGANSINSYSVVFKDPDNDDYHLDISDSRLRGIGADLSTSFTKDIEGELRDQTGAWDIGADEFNDFIYRPFSHYIALNGTTDYINTPDSAANSVTGDIEIIARVALDDYTPSAHSNAIVGKVSSAGAESSYIFWFTSSDLQFLFRNASSTLRTATANAAHSLTDGQSYWLRVTWTASSGATNFYKSSDGAIDPSLVSWTQIGTTVTIGAGEAIQNGNTPLCLGAGQDGAQYQAAGKFYYAEVRDGIDGTIVARFNASEIDQTETYISNTDGEEKWTNNGGTYISA